MKRGIEREILNVWKQNLKDYKPFFFFTKCFISRVSGSEGSAPNLKVLDQGEIACVTQECGNQVSLPVITEIP